MTTTAHRAAGICWLIALGAMWLAVIRQFGPQWTVYPQYNYGWGVPFLCLYLFWERWLTRPDLEPPQHKSIAFIVAAGAAMILAVSRWAHEANTSWRITTWSMALCAVIVTLAAVYLLAGTRWTRYFAFPICFFLVAVPWPSSWENFVIQSLTQLNAGATVEIVSFAGIPALQHGNVIEVSTGMIGIDEACSGIRSLQATFMIALFFGELYRFGKARRVALVGVGALLAMLFNLGRTILLVVVGAHQGIAAISRWHDPAGVTILVGCFMGLWGAALWMKTKSSPQPAPHQPAPLPSVRWSFPITLLVCVVAMETGTEAWYRSHENRVVSAAQWTIHWPTNVPNLQSVEISPRVRGELVYDEGSSVRWSDRVAGMRWQGFFFHWNSADTLQGRVKLQSVKAHRPDVCLPAAGLVQDTVLGVKSFDAGTMTLPFNRYIFEDSSGPIYVFYTFLEDGAKTPAEMLNNPRSRIAAAVSGVRGLGERLVEIAVTGPANQAEAEAAFSRLLPSLIISQPANGK